MQLSLEPGRRRPAVVAAVVVTYQPDLERLSRVLSASSPQVYRLAIVDNASTDEAELRALVESFPNTDFLRNWSNIGVGAALNAGVEHCLRYSPRWILTLDQDTIIDRSAVTALLTDWEQLDQSREAAAILAMSAVDRAPPQRVRRRWMERALILAEGPIWREMLQVITSGNLVRAEVFSIFRYNEDFFIDHVDNAFCADLRRSGYLILEHVVPTMDHQLGRQVSTRRGEKSYEGGIRLYYICRNGLYLVVRRRMPFRLLLAGLYGFSLVYFEVNGWPALLPLVRMLLRGLIDGVVGNLGPRDEHLRPLGRRDQRVRVRSR